MKNQENKPQKTDITKRLIVSLAVLLPIIIASEIIWINSIFRLLSEPSDFAVFFGLLLLSLFLFANYFLFSKIYKTIKQNKK